MTPQPGPRMLQRQATGVETSAMRPRVYEIIFAGEAVPAVGGAFEEFDVEVGAGRTTLRAELADQAALHDALDRLVGLGLELLEVRTVDGTDKETAMPDPCSEMDRGTARHAEQTQAGPDSRPDDCPTPGGQ
jgi:hypothetical protein